ncbi:glutamine synthetase family protein [Streptosporangium carneum]|uniref:Glutamine synthetase n=1 Tax=Streptosporangium carneum TaxID=47481 RepID=A0A9W6I7Y8_9ACTN|nr:glutamine synthetase family protein [Streptosporangium carneum]GLK13278.1 glutamine synthetase [Streptosporangium carneum]
MTGAPTVFAATCDLAAQLRGRAVPASREEALLRGGTGWVPADLAITSFGPIAENVFGSTGDLRLMPDPSTRVDIPADGDVPAVRLYLADQTLPDGTPWECCPRGFLASAVADLRAELGVTVVASFEHEFTLSGLPSSPPFSFERYRTAEPFGSELVTLLEEAGFEPETWLPEYGEAQHEITLSPADGLVAADRAVLLRELVRDLARRRGLRAGFAPLPDPEGSGNGVHIHLSFRDADGRPALHDPSRPGGLSELGTRLSAGILRHASALTAVTAASPVSFLRLTPHRWSAGGAFLAERNREAMLRICPGTGPDAGAQLNLEYRAADATANPWLALGVLLRAGLEGIRRNYPEPVVWPESATEAELADAQPLPTSQREALDALEKDDVVRGFLPADLLTTYLSVKRAELEALAGLDDTERCRRIADVH